MTRALDLAAEMLALEAKATADPEYSVADLRLAAYLRDHCVEIANTLIAQQAEIERLRAAIQDEST